MGAKKQSIVSAYPENQLMIEKMNLDDKIIALAGNPNVGKSTVFNSLTGLNQHTGNWPGKTVTNAQGRYLHKGNAFILVDIPGIYSLMANSMEEEVARDFICFGNPDATVIVADATCLERNLNLVLQTLEITNASIVCVNLLDEAKRKKVNIDLKELSKQLGIPVVGTCARDSKGLSELMDEVYNLTHKKPSKTNYIIKYDKPIEEAIAILEPSIREFIGDFSSRWIALKLLDGDKTLINSINQYLKIDILEEIKIVTKLQLAREVLLNAGIDNNLFRDKVVSRIVIKAEEISGKVVSYKNDKYNLRDRKIDKVLTSKTFGIPIMLALLGFVFWLTIIGANYPSQIISDGLFWLEIKINEFFISIESPRWLQGLLIDGMYRTLAWVVAVMLPPMAIFFPLFSLLEDLGYLPRIAFNLDNFFKKACAHGKQALTMCMGFGCNAAGVVGCRIIDSPRERLIAIITNNFVPCNGRFPTLVSVITIFFAGFFVGPLRSFVSATILTMLIVLSVVMTLLLSKILSRTILKGLPSSFTLELPPYRRPQIGKVITRSIFDRTLFVLGRAIAVAAPAGVIIWIMANIIVGDISLLSYCADFLNPLAQMVGLDGYILMAFILGFPANEIVLPIIIMSYMSKGSLLQLDNLNQLSNLLIKNGWTWLTAVCFIIFTLMHWPCGTTFLTIKKETQSWKWTIVSFLVPTITGLTICFIITTFVKLFSIM
ncbi:MAG: ferrous iron transport protein B [Clostridiaceae bacterium]|jgi:ferrous iron transport protein B|nr:ferrous iron transport protein B [Clostridiaceae bacterium]